MSSKIIPLLLTIACLTGVGCIGFGVWKLQKPSSSSTSSQVLGAYSSQNGYKERYTTITRGAVTFTGNALERDNPQYGNNNTGGTFVTLDNTLQDSPYGPGTTSDWTKNASAAQLRIPAQATVLHAELIWGSNYIFRENDITKDIDTPVKFTLPDGQTKQISPDPTTSGISYTEPTDDKNDHYYVRTQNVTDLVKSAGAGQYIVGSVPGIVNRSNDHSNGAGWTLAVAYADATQPARKLSIYTTLEPIASNTTGNLVEVQNFSTPRSSTVNGRLLISALEGDNTLTGDQFTFGDTPDTLNKISGPNNPEDNFFGSYINDDKGNLDTSGTLGNNNEQSGGITGEERHGWDITNIDVSKYLKPSQSKAYAQATSKGDGYLVTALGLQIDVFSPVIEMNFNADREGTDVCNGDIITYTLTVKNTGQANADDNTIKTSIPAGTTLVPDSLKIDNQATPYDANTGIKLGTIEPGRTITIAYKVKAIQQGTANLYDNQASDDYNYLVLDNLPRVQDKAQSQLVHVQSQGSSSCVIVHNPNPNPTGPAAKDDIIIVLPGKPTIIDVTANDTSIDSKTLRDVTQPAHGQVIIQNGKILYSPNPGYTGQDTFTYKVCDPNQNCVTAKVIITIQDSTTVTQPRPGQVLGAYENTELPRTGGGFLFWAGIMAMSVLVIGIGATMISQFDPEKPERLDE